MPHATQFYLQYNPSACTSCQACLYNCPPACIYFNPLCIMSDECLLCERCIPMCPESDKVFAQGSKLLGKEWFWFVQPPASENPSPNNPSEAESSTESKEDKSDSKGESKDESQGDSSLTPADKAKLEALKNALLSAPPPLQDTIKRKDYKRDRITKAIHIHNELKSLIARLCA